LTEYREINVNVTLALAEEAARAGVRRFVFISSIKVNGEQTPPSRPFRPSDVPVPRGAYSISKREAEEGLNMLAQKTGLEVVIIRAPLVYGPGVKGNFAAMIRWLRKGVPLPFGAVQNKRSLVALDNLVDFISLCANADKSPLAANQLFLISDGEDVSTAELLRKVARGYGVNPRLVPLPVKLIRILSRLSGRRAVADRLLSSLQVDSSKARALLGWTPIVSMDEQLQEMVRYDSRV
jgi:nucleoside-diphosphate-sugar epimerase